MKPIVVCIAITLMTVTRAAIIQCPKVVCAEQDRLKPVKADLCYKHDQQQPNAYVQIYDCDWYQFWGLSKLQDASVACELDLLNNKFAWVDETTQQSGTDGYLNETLTPLFSQINHKRTEAYCLAISSYKVMLNNGRTCSDPWQCTSLNCHNSVCKGLPQGEFCFEHQDCDA